MKLSRYPNNLSQFNDSIHQQITNIPQKENNFCQQNTTVQYVKKFSSKTQASDLSESISSESNTPRKNSGYSTHEDEESFDEHSEECCESFMECGSCMKGALCEFGHHSQQRTLSRPSIKMALMNSFPQLLSISTMHRTRSFLA